jgi:hypothetical protein
MISSRDRPIVQAIEGTRAMSSDTRAVDANGARRLFVIVVICAFIGTFRRFRHPSAVAWVHARIKVSLRVFRLRA